MANRGQEAKTKPCYNCVKRRIVCDRSPVCCRKCVKKGLACPGYGIRYRFANEFRDRKSASGTPTAPGGGSSTSTGARARRDGGSSSSSSNSNNKNDDISPDGPGYCGPLKWTDTETQATFTHALSSAGPDEVEEDEEDDTNSESPQSSETTSEPDQQCDVLAVATTQPHRQLPYRLELPRRLEPIDAKSRWMFNYFSEHVSPVMMLFNSASNGYRRHVLPFAVTNPLVQRAVCVAAAFHLLPRRPELRAPAEQGRAAIIQRLREDGLSATRAPVLDDATWATILLLIVGDLIRGDEQVMILYHMLDAFLRTRRGHQPTSELAQFLDAQSKLIKFFGEPIVSESSTVTQVSQTPRTAILSTLSATELPPEDAPEATEYIPLYNEGFRLAMDIYLLRARSAEVPVLEDHMEKLVRDLHAALERVDMKQPGAHVLVWPHFVGAAEAEDKGQRDFFTARLRYIWRTTGYANVLKAIDSLPGIWEKRGVERWTRALPQLSVVVM